MCSSGLLAPRNFVRLRQAKQRRDRVDAGCGFVVVTAAHSEVEVKGERPLARAARVDVQGAGSPSAVIGIREGAGKGEGLVGGRSVARADSGIKARAASSGLAELGVAALLEVADKNSFSGCPFRIDGHATPLTGATPRELYIEGVKGALNVVIGSSGQGVRNEGLVLGLTAGGIAVAAISAHAVARDAETAGFVGGVAILVIAITITIAVDAFPAVVITAVSMADTAAITPTGPVWRGAPAGTRTAARCPQGRLFLGDWHGL